MINGYFTSFKFAKSTSIIAAVIGLAACSHIPASTMFKMATMDTDKIKPTQSKYAFKIPNNIKVAKGSIKVSLKFLKQTDILKDHTFILQKTAVNNSQHLASQAQKGYYLEAYQFSANDKVIGDKLFTEIKKQSKAKTKQNHGSLTVSFEFCKTQNTQVSSHLINQYTQFSPADDYITILKNVNVIDQLNKHNNKPKITNIPNCK